MDPARPVPNPAWRRLRNELRKGRRQAGKLRREEEAKEHRDAVRAETRTVERHIEGLERARAATDLHVQAGELDPALRLETLPETWRGLWDGLCMNANRPETRIAVTVAPELGQPATVRSFVKAIFQADANLPPDPAAGILRVQLLPLTTLPPARRRGGPVPTTQRLPGGLSRHPPAPRVRNPVRPPVTRAAGLAVRRAGCNRWTSPGSSGWPQSHSAPRS